MEIRIAMVLLVLFFAHCNFTEAIFFAGLVSYTILVSVYIMSGMEITGHGHAHVGQT